MTDAPQQLLILWTQGGLETARNTGEFLAQWLRLKSGRRLITV